MKQSSKLSGVPSNKLVWQGWSLLPKNHLRKNSPVYGHSERGKKYSYSLNIPQFCWCPITSSEKRFSAKIAQQGREQKTQHSNWLEGTIRSLRLHVPQEQQKFTLNHDVSLLPFSSLSRPPGSCRCFGRTMSPPLPLILSLFWHSVSGILSSGCHWPPASDYRLWA